VLLQVESFASMRAHTRERCVELIAAINNLKRNGSWVPPPEDESEVNILYDRLAMFKTLRWQRLACIEC